MNRRSTPTPVRLQWLEIGLLTAILAALGAVRYGRITPPERQEIHLEAGLLLLHELEAEHFARTGTYLPPDTPRWRPYVPWMSRFRTQVRFGGPQGWSVVVHADLDGDGEAGAWRVDHQGPAVVRLVED